MDDAELLAAWRTEAAVPHQGWDFSYLDGRWHEESPPWDFAAICRDRLAEAGSALDMGTGGGEKLLELADALPPDTWATEGWPPNVPLARDRLAPYGIGLAVYDAESDPAMPFDDARFDLVVNRHEAFVSDEVHRVLRPGGTFLTQQVLGTQFAEAHALFGTPVLHPEIVPNLVRAELETSGLMITDADAWTGHVTFADVGTFVHYVTIVPWDVPADFSVDAYARPLLDLHHRTVGVGRPLRFSTGRFWFAARKPH